MRQLPPEPITAVGQKAKYSERADDFRLTPENGHHTSGLSVFNSNSVRVNQAHRSSADKLQRFDHPPPHGWSGRTRGSKSDLKYSQPQCLLSPNELTSSARAVTSVSCRYCCKSLFRVKYENFKDR